MKCSLTGTILTNRKNLPTEIKKPKFLGWKDRKVVTCLTTKVDKGMTSVKRITRGDVDITIKKPNIVLNYIKYMKGLDWADQLLFSAKIH